MITRINVPKPHRGNGVGSKLLSTICKDADELGATLKLEINSYGEMTDAQLKEWYKRYGFAYDFEERLWVREPKRIT